MLIGYTRVSTGDQTKALQLDALKAAGCEEFFSDVINGDKKARPRLDEMLEYARKGDTIVVWRLDRLGRSLKHLLELVTQFREKGIGFKSLQEGMDTETNGGRLIFHIFGALAEFEHNLIKERTQAGLKAARARGRVGGRPRSLNDPKALKLLKTMYDDPQAYTTADICQHFNISRATLYRTLKTL